MKKTLCIGLAIIMLLSAFSITALAENPTQDGIYDVTVNGENVTITFLKENNATIEAVNAEIDNKSTQLYADAVKMQLEISGATGQFQLIMAQSEEGAPTADNIVYIDQTSPEDEKVTFMVYPSKLESGKVYHIYLATNTEGRKVIASFKYYVSRLLGDVDGDGDVTAGDALLVLQNVVGLVEFNDVEKRAANVNMDDCIDAGDALNILQYVVGIIESFT